MLTKPQLQLTDSFGWWDTEDEHGGKNTAVLSCSRAFPSTMELPLSKIAGGSWGGAKWAAGMGQLVGTEPLGWEWRERDQQCVLVSGRMSLGSHGTQTMHGPIEEKHRFEPAFHQPRFQDMVPHQDRFLHQGCLCSRSVGLLLCWPGVVLALRTGNVLSVQSKPLLPACRESPFRSMSSDSWKELSSAVGKMGVEDTSPLSGQVLHGFCSTYLVLQQSLGERNVSSRRSREEECYWKMFLIIAEIFSKWFVIFIFFFFL